MRRYAPSGRYGWCTLIAHFRRLPLFIQQANEYLEILAKKLGVVLHPKKLSKGDNAMDKGGSQADDPEVAEHQEEDGVGENVD